MRALLGATLAALGLGALHTPVRAEAPAASTTREVVLERADHGYRWKLIETAVPTVAAHDILVRVHAVALNRGDLDILEPDEGRDHTGLIAASDAAGEIVAVGSAVSGAHKGERVTSTYFRNWTGGPFRQELLTSVHGWTVNGVLSEYIVLADTGFAPMPAQLTYEEAATLPTAGLTAWAAVTEGRPLRPGEVVVVQGTGGVAVFALQFAAAAGAHVIVTSSSDEKLQRARTLGAAEGINYRTVPKWSERVRELTHSHGADLVVDLGGKDTLEQSIRSVADSGAVSVVGGLSGYDGTISAEGLLMKRARAQGIFVGSRADLLRMNAFMSAHHIHPVIDRIFPFEQYADALAYMKAGSFIGKIVIHLD